MRSPGQPDGKSAQSQQLLLTAALADGAAAVRAWQLWCDAFDLDSLDGAGFWVLPLVYRNLLSAGFSGPEKGRLAGVCKQMRLIGAVKLPSVLALITDLREAGVRALPGPLLSAVLMHPQTALPAEPAELLVPFDDVEAADTWLRSHGWSPQPSLPARPLRAFIPRVRYRGRDGLDLHIRWRPFGADCPVEADAGCWQRASARRLEAGTFEVADRADLLKAADAMDSLVQSAVLRSLFGSPGDWRSSLADGQASAPRSLVALARLHWRRFRDCPGPARPASFAGYVFACHAYWWRTTSLAGWFATAARKLAGRFFG